MCGISGIFAFNEQGLVFRERLPAATNAIASRGPDSQGIFNHGPVGLGHRRLSIIDVTDDGCQPMADVSERYTIVFNGEIFNYLELKEKLLAQGHTFRSQTDTEVLLTLYINDGPAFLNRLNGFFAFAIYDREEQSLFLARDRMGVKPLLYYRDADKLIFASEMKSLLAFGIPRELDMVSVYQFFQFTYIPAPASVFKDVMKLEPGNYLLLHRGQVENKPWYRIPYNPQQVRANTSSYQEQQQQLVQLLDAAVQRRLVADVPLGAFLSGGIDSSVIVALASRYTPHLNTFSIGFRDEPFFDETKYARLVADQYKTNHTVFSLTNDDLYGHIFDLLDYTDEPFADSSALAVHILSQRTRQQVTVALSGDGADEVFSGYNKHMGEFRVRQGGAAAMAVSALSPLWKALPKSRNAFFGNRVRQLQRFADGMQLSAKERYYRWASFVGEGDAARLFTPATWRKVEDRVYGQRKERILQHITADGDMNEVLYTDMHLVLPNDMLTKVDLMSMANGLEVRTPFLDYTVVDFAFTLPEAAKIDRQMKKKIVQDAFRDMLPPELYQRPKHGFEVPLLKWFRGGLRTLITEDLLADDFIEHQGLFAVDEIRKLKQQLFSNNPEDIHVRIWSLVVFQHWWKKWMA